MHGWVTAGHLKEHGLHAWTFYRLLYPIFIGSGIASFVAARRKRYQQHAEWALRHIAAGICVWPQGGRGAREGLEEGPTTHV
jgi:hypothetical protein